jgi:hypothetical protein
MKEFPKKKCLNIEYLSTLIANPTICTDVCGRATLCGVVVDPIAGAKTPFLPAETARVRCFVNYHLDCRLLCVHHIRLQRLLLHWDVLMEIPRRRVRMTV